MTIFRKVLHSKIHRASVTEANLSYEGSITISADLLNAARMLPGEAVQIWNVTTGARFETYTIEGPEASTEITINGAAARLASPGDLVIIASFVLLSEDEALSYKPIAVFVDANNKIQEIRSERISTLR